MIVQVIDVLQLVPQRPEAQKELEERGRLSGLVTNRPWPGADGNSQATQKVSTPWLLVSLLVFFAAACLTNWII